MPWTIILSIFTRLMPAALLAVETVSQDKGKPANEVIDDVIAHLTPGQPNAPSLSP
jgi:hypothetical protein